MSQDLAQSTVYARILKNGTASRWFFFAAAAASLFLTACQADAQTVIGHVNLNAALPALATVPSTAYGVNTATWDSLMTDPAAPGLVKAADFSLLRYPGGSWADAYHWQTNSGTTGSGESPNPNDDFDNFMTLANASGATPIIIANYGSNAAGTAGGDPTEAAAWVAYAKSKNYGVKYWEIGNEVYGNGEYGNGWEEDLHSDHSPTAYGKNALTYISDMKAQDSTIKVGVVLACPTQWPAGQSPDWNSNVLEQCGSSIDFVIIHWYPQSPGDESDPGLLAQTSQLASIVSAVNSEIQEYCGSNAGNVKIFVTETNSVSGAPGKQIVGLVNALFLADELPTWIELGAANVDIWDLHNGLDEGNNNSASLYGTADYGDYGILSSGDSDSSSGVAEPAAETPFPSYYGAQMDSYLAKPGDALLPVDSDQPLVSAHSALTSANQLTTLIINKDPAHSYRTTINVNGYVPQSTATDYFYGESSSGAITSSKIAAAHQIKVTLPPYSLTALVLAKSASATLPGFKSTASAVAKKISPGQTGTMKVTFEALNTAESNVTPVIKIYDPNWNVVAQQTYPSTNIGANKTFTGSASYASTASSPIGHYHVEADVKDASGNILYTDNPGQNFAVVSPDTAVYNFESSTQGWASSSATVTSVAYSNAEAYAGAESLGITLNETGGDNSPIIGVTPPSSLTAGETVTFHVWIPGTSTITAVQPYVQQGSAGNYTWTGDYTGVGSLTLNAWNTLTVTVPSNAVTPLFSLGVQFILSGDWTGNVYVDTVNW